ncbi:MAG: hypothetical protein AAGC95_02795 [Pseudomonadota bacterium]
MALSSRPSIKQALAAASFAAIAPVQANDMPLDVAPEGAGPFQRFVTLFNGREYTERDKAAKRAEMREYLRNNPYEGLRAFDAYEAGSLEQAAAINERYNREHESREARIRQLSKQPTIERSQTTGGGVENSVGVGIDVGLEASSRASSYTNTQMSVTVPMTSPEIERAKLDAEKEKAKTEFLLRVQNDPDAYERLVEDYVDAQHTDSKDRSDKQNLLMRVQEDIQHRSGGHFSARPDTANNILRNTSNSSDVETGMNADPRFRNHEREEHRKILRGLGLKDEVIDDYIDGKMSASEALQKSGLTKDQFQGNITAYYSQNITINPTVEKESKTEEQIREEAAEKIREEVAYRRKWGKAVENVSLLVFGDNDDVYEAKKAYDTGLDIYEGVSLLINDALDPSGISLVAGGINMLAGAKNKQSAEQQMLDKVLEELEAIRKQLQKIEQKLDIALGKLDDIILAAEDLKQGNAERFVKLMRELSDNEVQSQKREALYAQYALANKLKIDSAGVLGTFVNEGEGVELLRQCLQEDRKCQWKGVHTIDPKSPFYRIQEEANSWWGFLTDTVRSPSYQYFNDFMTMSAEEIEARIEGDDAALAAIFDRQNKSRFIHSVEQRVEVFPDIAQWLNQQGFRHGLLEVSEPLRETDGEQAEAKPTPDAQLKEKVVRYPMIDGESLEIAHPHFVTRVGVPEYAKLTLHLPKSAGYHAASPQAYEIREMVLDIDQASLEMRKNVELARAVYAANLAEALNAIEARMTALGEVHLLAFKSNEEDYPGKLGIAYADNTAQQIRNEITTASHEKLLRIGEKIGILRLSGWLSDPVVGEIERIYFSENYPDLSDKAKGLISQHAPQFMTPSGGIQIWRNKKANSTSYLYPPIQNAIQELLMYHIGVAQNRAFKDFSYVSPLQPFFHDIERARFALDTLMKGGYGDAYIFDAGTESLRKSSELMTRIDDELNKLAQPDAHLKSLADVVAAYEAIEKLQQEFEALNLSFETIRVHDERLDMGMGNVDGALEHLNTIPHVQ